MQRRRLLLVAAICAWWTLEGFTTAGSLLTMQFSDETLTLSEALRRGVLSAWLWIPCSIALFWLVERHPLERGRIARSIAVFTVAALAVVLFRAITIYLCEPVLDWYEAPPKFGDVLVTSVLNNFLLSWLNIGVAHAVLYAQRAYDRQRQAEQLQARLAETQLDALRAQLDPHFLFNALNSIAETIHRDPVAADRMLVGLGELLRSSLERRETRVVTLDEELRLLRHYLQIEQARLGDRLSVRWDVASDLDDALVPPLLLQPLAENAIRHAIAAKIAPGWLDVRAWREEGQLWLAIRDDGGAGPAKIRNGVGLSNIRARLQLLYGDDHVLELLPLDGGGTQARVRLPLTRGARMREAA
jgi:signal transduction histidine kinase